VETVALVNALTVNAHAWEKMRDAPPTSNAAQAFVLSMESVQERIQYSTKH
jgi:hypothetical protein